MSRGSFGPVYPLGMLLYPSECYQGLIISTSASQQLAFEQLNEVGVGSMTGEDQRQGTLSSNPKLRSDSCPKWNKRSLQFRRSRFV